MCIFHSQEIAWKRENGFGSWIRSLLHLVQTEEEYFTYYDFAEFVFVGGIPPEEDPSSTPPFRISDRTLRKMAYFTAASFVDPVEIEAVDFQEGASFGDASFAQDLSVRKVRFGGLDMTRSNFAGCVTFSDVEFRSFAFIDRVKFSGSGLGFQAKFEDCVFGAITTFSGADFDLGDEATAGFVRVQFLDVVDFKGTAFHCQVVFTDVTFASAADFIDTLFDTVKTSARYRGAAVEFNELRLPEQATLVFRSTDRLRKMFDHDVLISFHEDPAGIISFENVNYNQLTPASRERLHRLMKSGHVEIGPGCIKYRLQTEVRTIPISQGNSALILEMCQTFTNYFTATSGWNLGFELVDRTQSEVSFFYFSDEDISEETFYERLARTEQRLWNLLSVRPDGTGSTPALEDPGESRSASDEENAVINAVDAISAMLGTFFRVGARIACGAWKARDSKRLLEAIQFHEEEGSERRAQSLHRALVDRYTGDTLFGINRKQNELLEPMVVEPPKLLESGKIKILFLGANTGTPRLWLDDEVEQIRRSLRMAKARDYLELQQVWAVTVDSLRQALVDESPRIVHFSGHGNANGIFLQDDTGKQKLVTKEALSRLFQLMADSVHCVVLNSCHSRVQAEAIREHIPYVIGMSASMAERAALAFSTGFYQGIGAGKEVEFAFALGLANIDLEDLPYVDRPVLLSRARSD